MDAANAFSGRRGHFWATLPGVKVHKNLAEAVITTLESTLQEGKVAERVLEGAFKANPRWGKRDRTFIAENTYEILRWRRRLAPDADTSNLWTLLAAQLLRSHPGEALPEWEQWAGLDQAALRTHFNSPELSPAQLGSVPDWLHQLALSELGPRWETELQALNGNAPVTLRANTLKINREQLQKVLLEEGVGTVVVAGVPDALLMQERRSLNGLTSMRQGLFSVQDAGSQQIAPFLQVEPGHRVMDACAGAGGKTLHLAALMRNRGELLALDIAETKLQELRRRAAQAGATVNTAFATPDVFVRWQNRADRLLLDVPCTGLGTLRRQPDLKWRLTPDFLEALQHKQRTILERYSSALKPGGLLVYATCSLLRSENEDQIQWFLQRGTFRLQEEKRIWPSEGNTDGFYMARLQKLE